MATTTQAPRAPQDHKSKQSEILAAEAANEMPAGGELLRIDNLPAWDQAEAIAQLTDFFAELGVDLDEPESIAEVKLDSKTIRVLGRMTKMLIDYTSDVDAFTEIVSGPGAFSRGIELAMWYFGALGEESSSVSS